MWNIPLSECAPNIVPYCTIYPVFHYTTSHIYIYNIYNIHTKDIYINAKQKNYILMCYQMFYWSQGRKASTASGQILACCPVMTWQLSYLTGQFLHGSELWFLMCVSVLILLLPTLSSLMSFIAQFSAWEVSPVDCRAVRHWISSKQQYPVHHTSVQLPAVNTSSRENE